MSGRKITIEFLGNDKTASSVANQVERRFGKLGRTLDRVGQVAGRVLAVGLVAGAVAAGKAMKAAAADDAAQQKLANTLRNAAGATAGQIKQTEDWITAQGKLLGVSDDELRPALGKLTVATGDLGKAQDLATLAMDVSAGSGKSLESVSFALAKAQNGNVTGLSRLGIATKDAHGKTLSLDQITKNLANTYKGQAATAADTAAGRQRKLSVAFGELQEKIGTKLLPVMEKLSEVGLKMVDWIDRNQTATGILVGGVGGLAVALYAASVAMRAAATASAAWAALMKLGTVITIAQTAATYALGTAWLVGRLAAIGFAAGVRLLGAAWAANPLGVAIIAIAALVAGFVWAYKNVGWFRKGVDFAVKGIGKAFTWLYNNAVGPVISAILKAFAKVMLAMGRMLQILSKAPNMGWVKKYGDALVGRARDADHMGDRVKKIPNNKNVKISVEAQAAIDRINRLQYKIKNLQGKTIAIKVAGGKQLAYAKGTNYHPGGLAVVGEDGPELAALPRGTKVFSNQKSKQMMQSMAGQLSPAGLSGRGGGGDTYNITVNGAMDADAVAKQIHVMLAKRRSSVGRPLGLEG